MTGPCKAAPAPLPTSPSSPIVVLPRPLHQAADPVSCLACVDQWCRHGVGRDSHGPAMDRKPARSQKGKPLPHRRSDFFHPRPYYSRALLLLSRYLPSWFNFMRAPSADLFWFLCFVPRRSPSPPLPTMLLCSENTNFDCDDWFGPLRCVHHVFELEDPMYWRTVGHVLAESVACFPSGGLEDPRRPDGTDIHSFGGVCAPAVRFC